MKTLVFSLLLFFLLIVPQSAQSKGWNFKFKPVFLPIEFKLSRDGVSVNVTKSVVTPIGSFGVGYEEELLEARKKSIREVKTKYLERAHVVEIVTEDRTYLYRINGAEFIEISTSGLQTTRVSKNYTCLLYTSPSPRDRG